jgi:hypothetical protein
MPKPLRLSSPLGDACWRPGGGVKRDAGLVGVMRAPGSFHPDTVRPLASAVGVELAHVLTSLMLSKMITSKHAVCSWASVSHPSHVVR